MGYNATQIFYPIDTTEGHDGSSVRKGWTVFGVHIGRHGFDDLNQGARITQDRYYLIKDWIL